MEKLEIYRFVLPELKKVLAWSKDPKYPEDFDIDSCFGALFEKHNIAMSYGFMYRIFLLTDNLYDSVGHNHEEIRTGYTINNGIDDLQAIIDYIEQGNIIGLEGDVRLKGRLIRLNRE